MTVIPHCPKGAVIHDEKGLHIVGRNPDNSGINNFNVGMTILCGSIAQLTRIISSHCPEGSVIFENQAMPSTRCHLVHSGFYHLGRRFDCCVDGSMPGATIMIMTH